MRLFHRLSGKAVPIGGIRRSDPDLSRSFAPFWERLHEAIEWCRQRIDLDHPQHCLRSDETRPRTLERDYFAAVASVATVRRHRVPSEPAPHALGEGRLLVYFPNDELADGAAEVQSQGFFDIFNAPPWDTWVAMVEESGRARHNLAGRL